MIECHLNLGPEGRDLLIGISTHTKSFQRQKRAWQLLLGIGGAFVLVCAILGKSIPLILAGVLLLVAAVCVLPLQKAGMRHMLKKADPRIVEGDRNYTISDSGIDILSYAGSSHTTWDAYTAYGAYEHYTWIQRVDRNVVIIDRDSLTPAQNTELLDYLTKHIHKK